MNIAWSDEVARDNRLSSASPLRFPWSIPFQFQLKSAPGSGDTGLGVGAVPKESIVATDTTFCMMMSLSVEGVHKLGKPNHRQPPSRARSRHRCLILSAHGRSELFFASGLGDWGVRTTGTESRCSASASLPRRPLLVCWLTAIFDADCSHSVVWRHALSFFLRHSCRSLCSRADAIRSAELVCTVCTLPCVTGGQEAGLPSRSIGSRKPTDRMPRLLGAPRGSPRGSTYQLKAGQCRTGQYLHWAKKRPDPQCWWCQAPSQTREHLFKGCPKRKREQKILWAEVRKETGRGKSQCRIRDLFADERCSRAVLDFLTSTDVGKIVPAVEEDAGSEASEWELRERRSRSRKGGRRRRR